MDERENPMRSDRVGCTAIRVAVPDEETRLRLEAHATKAILDVWSPEGGGQLSEPVDLLVLPYHLPVAKLSMLAPDRTRVVQSQMLGFEGVRDHLPAGITYCNAVDVHEGSTAELALALTLSAQRDLPAHRDQQRQRRWSPQFSPGLAGRNVAIVGAGGVGAAIADRMVPFGANITLFARSPRASRWGEIRAIETLPAYLEQMDIVIIAVPLTPETRGLVDIAFLAGMKQGALLVNVSRGGTVDTTALVAETRSGRIRAALDVVDPEPLPPEHPLWATPGVIITPHVGGSTRTMDTRMDRLIIEQITRIAAGLRPLNVIIDGLAK